MEKETAVNITQLKSIIKKDIRNLKVTNQVATEKGRIEEKDAILDVVIIRKDEFDHLIQTNTNDPYLNCHSKQEQNKIEDLYTRIEEDTYNLKKNETIIKRVYSVYKNKLVRNVKKYVKYNKYFDDYKEEYSYAN